MLPPLFNMIILTNYQWKYHYYWIRITAIASLSLFPPSSFLPSILPPSPSPFIWLFLNCWVVFVCHKFELPSVSVLQAHENIQAWETHAMRRFECGDIIFLRNRLHKLIVHHVAMPTRIISISSSNIKSLCRNNSNGMINPFHSLPPSAHLSPPPLSLPGEEMPLTYHFTLSIRVCATRTSTLTKGEIPFVQNTPQWTVEDKWKMRISSKMVERRGVG